MNHVSRWIKISALLGSLLLSTTPVAFAQLASVTVAPPVIRSDSEEFTVLVSTAVNVVVTGNTLPGVFRLYVVLTRTDTRPPQDICNAIVPGGSTETICSVTLEPGTYVLAARTDAQTGTATVEVQLTP